jgi:hypothetical protein
MRRLVLVLFILIIILIIEASFLVYLSRKSHIDLKGALVILDNFIYEKSIYRNIEDVDWVVGRVKYVITAENLQRENLNIGENEEVIYFAYFMYPNDPIYYIQTVIYRDESCSGVFEEKRYDERITFDTFKSKILGKKVRIKIIRPKYEEVEDLSKAGLSVRNKLNQLVGWEIAVCD